MAGNFRGNCAHADRNCNACPCQRCLIQRIITKNRETDQTVLNIHMYRAQCVSIMRKTYPVAVKATHVNSWLAATNQTRLLDPRRDHVTFSSPLHIVWSLPNRLDETRRKNIHSRTSPDMRRFGGMTRHLESSVIITLTRRNTPQTSYLRSVYRCNACSGATQWNRSVKNQPQLRERVSTTRIIICHEIVAISTMSLKFSNRLCESFSSFISDQLKRTLPLCQNSV